MCKNAYIWVIIEYTVLGLVPMDKYSFGMCYKIHENNFSDLKKFTTATERRNLQNPQNLKIKIFKIFHVGLSLERYGLEEQFFIVWPKATQ